MREPSKKFLAAVEDSYLATKWVSDHALELGIDPERIAVGGDSSRGTLAAVDCQFARQAGSPGFALKALLCRLPTWVLTANRARLLLSATSSTRQL
jgi:acetyl esterase/lipase